MVEMLAAAVKNEFAPAQVYAVPDRLRITMQGKRNEYRGRCEGQECDARRAFNDADESEAVQLDPRHIRSEGIASREHKVDVQPWHTPSIVIGIREGVGAAPNHWPSLCRASGLAGWSLFGHE